MELPFFLLFSVCLENLHFFLQLTDHCSYHFIGSTCLSAVPLASNMVELN